MRLALALALAFTPLSPHAAPLDAKVVLYHFNLQYVAGGMSRFPDGVARDPNYNLSEEKVEDLIIVESFAPLLDVLERHPTWHIDLELQGLMVEVMAARHPAVLEKLRALAKAGQVEVVSFHYSDQLFLAYPRRDLVRSVLKNQQVFAQADLPLSGVVFTQEGQFNEGMLKVMREHGFTTVVMAHHLYDFEHAGTPPPSKFMSRHGVDVLLSGATTFGDLTTDWSGPGDGELIVTGDSNPYLGLRSFHVVPEEVAKWESERAAEEAAGKKLLTVTELVAAAKARGTFAELPPMTDGDWRPKDTHNLLRWMGGLGGLFDLLVITEQDDAVLTRNVRASLDVAACEAVAAWAADKKGAAARAAARDEAARELMLAQVSDSTGWNPWLGEVKYSLDHAQKAIDAARRCIDAEELRGAKKRRVDLKTGEVTDDPKDALSSGSGTAVDPPFAVAVNAPGREVTLSWSRLDAERLELSVAATAGSDPGDHRLLSLTFPMGFDRVVFAPATDEDGLVDYAASDFAPGLEHTLPAPSGLVGLGPGRFLVKDTRVSHLAVLVRPGKRELEVRDETLHADAAARWRFVVVDAEAARADQLAQAQNVTPTLEYPLEPRAGCGCQAGAAPLGLAALLGLLARGGRRARGAGRR